LKNATYIKFLLADWILEAWRVYSI